MEPSASSSDDATADAPSFTPINTDLLFNDSPSTEPGPTLDPANTGIEPIQFFGAAVAQYLPGAGVGANFSDPELALGGPRGDSSGQLGSLDVVTLGVGGALALSFDDNGERRGIFNGVGPDFIVFENPFFFGANRARVFAELAFVEVSSDGRSFARFSGSVSSSDSVGAFGTISTGSVSGLVGADPTFANVDKNDIDPFNPSAAGGTPFDLAELGGHENVVSGRVDLDSIRFVRIIDLVGDGSRSDGDGESIRDPFAEDLDLSADIDAVSVINGRTLEE
jgi:hypothetical protein